MTYAMLESMPWWRGAKRISGPRLVRESGNGAPWRPPDYLLELSTDRPDLTESRASSAWSWQVESGLLARGWPTTCRASQAGGGGDSCGIGLSELVEARIGGGYVHQRQS